MLHARNFLVFMGGSRGGMRGSGPPPPRNCQIIIFAMLKISVRPLLGILDPPPPPRENFLDPRKVFTSSQHARPVIPTVRHHLKKFGIQHARKKTKPSHVFILLHFFICLCCQSSQHAGMVSHPYHIIPGQTSYVTRVSTLLSALNGGRSSLIKR